MQGVVINLLQFITLNDRIYVEYILYKGFDLLEVRPFSDVSKTVVVF